MSTETVIMMLMVGTLGAWLLFMYILFNDRATRIEYRGRIWLDGTCTEGEPARRFTIEARWRVLGVPLRWQHRSTHDSWEAAALELDRLRRKELDRRGETWVEGGMLE